MRRTRRALVVATSLVVVLLGVATLLGFFDRLSWALEIVAFFRLQYAVGLAAAAALALVLRRFGIALVAVALVLVNAAATMPLPADGPARADGPGEHVRLLVANVEVGNREHDRMADLIRSADPDVVILTELTPAWALALAPALRAHRGRRLVLRPDAYGIGLYSRLPVAASSVERFPAGVGPPTVVARVDVAGSPLTLVGTHVHRPLEGSIHARHLAALAAARPRLGTPLAICGDFNTVPWSTGFRRLSNDGAVSHLFEDSSPGYTWPTWSAALRLPLDNCLLDGVAVRDFRRARDVGSDHFPLVVDLAVPAPRDAPA